MGQVTVGRNGEAGNKSCTPSVNTIKRKNVEKDYHIRRIRNEYGNHSHMYRMDCLMFCLCFVFASCLCLCVCACV